MRRLISFLLLCGVKIFSHIFFRGKFHWDQVSNDDKYFENVKLVIFLNHTSLYEPLFFQAAPFRFLWRLTFHAHIPGADVTLNRPIVGKFWKLLIPNISTITRKRDDSWDQFLKNIDEHSLIALAPEGRMKRPNGLDKFGRKMTVRGGVADIIDKLHEGKMLICLSGGLHHVQAPGILIPKLFKTISMNFVTMEISEYLKQFSAEPKRRKIEIIHDLQHRLENDCPQEI